MLADQPPANRSRKPDDRQAIVGREGGYTLSAGTTLGLFYIQRYRFLTIDQFARAGMLNRSTASNTLRTLERQGILGHFGNTGLAGQGKTPKVYFLTRKGWELLCRESDIPQDLIGTHKEVHVEAKWSAQMYHRLRLVDSMLSAECAVRIRPQLSMVKTFLEYRRTKRGNHIVRETSDFVGKEEIAENRIIPDAAFIMENIQTKRRALFFVEMDMATEQIVSHITRDSRVTLHHKFAQYDKYLKSLRYSQTYAAYGEFRSFILLFVTLSESRIENIRRELSDLPSDLAEYNRLTTYKAAMGDFFAPIWHSRSLSDTRLYPLVR